MRFISLLLSNMQKHLTPSEALRAELEAAAKKLGIAPSTLGRMAGQDGSFYRRLCENKRVWPETAEKVRANISQIVTPSQVAPSEEADSAR